ncbi:MAG TPA: DUF3048 domain-containing protein [Acidimicrobiales bacterium]
MTARFSLRAFASLCALALVAVGCGGGGDDGEDTAPSTTTTSTTTTTKPAPPPTAPLTGLPVTDPAVLQRPAMLVKINNADGNDCRTRSRPQVGLDQADIVIEEVVEGGITRFVGIFHSSIPETVGPVRSARSSDIDLILAFNQPLFAWSGNNANVGAELDAIGDSFVAVGHSTAAGGNYYRDNSGGRCAPSNLFVHPADLYAFVPGEGKPPTPVLPYRAPDEAPTAGGVPVAGVRLVSDLDTVFVWNAATSSWDRYQKRTKHLAAGDVPLSPTNVVVLDVEYKGSSTAGSPQAVSVGSGPAHVYLDGRVIDGSWSRESPQSPWVLTDANGAPIKLNPGRTWVQLAESGPPTNLDAAGVAPYLNG